LVEAVKGCDEGEALAISVPGLRHGFGMEGRRSPGGGDEQAEAWTVEGGGGGDAEGKDEGGVACKLDHEGDILKGKNANDMVNARGKTNMG
jgi:hypothetical protein